MLTVAENPVNLDPSIIAAGLAGLPQTECPVFHHFSDGVYIREMLIPAGTFIVGHSHKKGGVNFLLKGSGLLFVDGVAKQVDAPQILQTVAGAKMMHALTDVVWMNIFPNQSNERDIQTLEAALVDKSPEFLRLQQEMRSIESDAHIHDVANFSGVDERITKALSKLTVFDAECTAEFMPSPIHGGGAFAPFGLDEGANVGLYSCSDGKTALAAHVNHAKTPNCALHSFEDRVYLVTNKSIHGRLGGMHGEELTIDYRTLPNFIEVTQ